MGAELTAALAGLGLAGAAGLNAWLPLVLTGFAARWGLIDLDGEVAALAETPWLATVSAAFVLDLVGDKIPGVDHVLHLIGTAVHPAAGAVVAGGQAGADLPPWIVLTSGAVTSGAIHAARAALRPGSTVLTAGFGNPVLSAAEDAGSLVLSLVALLLPLLAALAVVVLLAVAARRVMAGGTGARIRRPPA